VRGHNAAAVDDTLPAQPSAPSSSPPPVELAPIHAAAVSPVVIDQPAAEACRNCGTVWPAPRPNYCTHCGQETHLKPPTLMEFVQQFGGSYISMEGALWRTLLLLLFRPGRLTKEYFAGRKRRYVLPLRLYLTISVVALLGLQWSGAMRPPTGAPLIQFDGEGKKRSETLLDQGDFTVLGLGGIEAGVKGGQFICKGLPDAWCERVRERFMLDVDGMEREMRKMPERFVSHWGSAMFALLPLYAFFLKLVYIDRRMRWSEHLVFALHLHAFIFAMVLVTLPGVPWLSGLVMAIIPIYSVIALQVVYGGRWWVSAFRMMTLGLCYFVALTTAMALVAVWAFIS
jgi:hypothetical protein